MKLSILIFITIVLAVYTSVNYYIYIRGLQAMPEIPWLRTSYKILFLIIFLSYIICRIFQSFSYTQIGEILFWLGSVWLGAMVYFFFIVIIFDLLRLLNHFFHIFPLIIQNNYSLVKQISIICSILLVAITFIFGYLNAQNPEIKEIEIKINKKAGDLKKLSIIAVSDIHSGTLVDNKQIQKIADAVQKLRPDMILFLGDLVDEIVPTNLNNHFDEPLKNLYAPMGVYGIFGNHEYYANFEKSKKFYKSLNIRLLCDESLKIDNKIYLIGRNDREYKRFTGNSRKSIAELLLDVDKNLPLILLDHQPFNLEESDSNGIDLQLSGHTHHGQIFPFNLITNKVYELSRGYMKKTHTQFYVSSGFGTWGPPIRTGSTPEILFVKINLEK
jgi:uncharacterized protein